jgi:hypothetical protein
MVVKFNDILYVYKSIIIIICIYILLRFLLKYIYKIKHEGKLMNDLINIASLKYRCKILSASSSKNKIIHPPSSIIN